VHFISYLKRGTGKVCVLPSFVTVFPEREVLTLLNLKPAVLVTTVGKDGSVNAAPFSRFSIVDYNPPRLLFSVNMERDTYRNVLETEEFVLNYPSTRLLKQIWVTSKHYPYGVSELEKADLSALPSERVTPPKIAECCVHMECRAVWTKPIGSSCLVLGDILSITMDRKMEQLKSKGKVGRLNPPLYFAFSEDQETRRWMFAEIGKLHTVAEKDEKAHITSKLL